MTSATVTLPDIGDYRDVPIIEVHVRPGDAVRLDDPLLTIESDKATLDIPSPVAGRVETVLVSVGARISKGDPVMQVVAAPVEPLPAAAPEPAGPAAATREAPQAAERPNPEAPATPAPVSPLLHASPSVRAFARELGVGLDAVVPGGRNGRILRDDVVRRVRQALAQPQPASVTAPSPGAAALDESALGPVRREPLSRIQKISGAALTRNWTTIPHVTNFDKADVTELEAFRQTVNAELRQGGAKLTMLAFLMKASAAALKTYPRFNASLDGDDLVIRETVDIGFAADTPQGLLVPVVRDCDRKGLMEIAAEAGALAERARKGSLAPREMQRGSFTVSSLGRVGGAGFTPIVNAPEVAILGAGRAAHEAVWDGAQFRPRLVLPVSLSWDHRAVDGVAAAKFLRRVAEVLEDLRKSLF